MNKIQIVSKISDWERHNQISDKYMTGLEYNDFYDPDILDDLEKCNNIINTYLEFNKDKYCTLHGAFLDVIVFSYDKRIRRISKDRMIQSMDIARRIGAKAVVFHTNVNPFLMNGEYFQRALLFTTEFLKELLEKYDDINIYLENMFDSDPYFLCKVSEELCCYHNYGICFDYAHAIISGTVIDKWIEALNRYIRHIHISDNDLRYDLHQAVGDGDINWSEFDYYYKRYFSECTLLIEISEPDSQIRSIEYLEHIGVIDLQ